MSGRYIMIKFQEGNFFKLSPEEKNTLSLYHLQNISCSTNKEILFQNQDIISLVDISF